MREKRRIGHRKDYRGYRNIQDGKGRNSKTVEGCSRWLDIRLESKLIAPPQSYRNGECLAPPQRYREGNGGSPFWCDCPSRCSPYIGTIHIV